MVAGRGIAHSERTSPEIRRSAQSYHGIQAWVALPREHEEGAPSFSHHPQATLPSIRREGVALRVIAGEAYGERSPVPMTWPTLYVDATLDAGATLEVPDSVEERAVYVATGRVGCEGDPFDPGDMIVLAPGARVCVRALAETRLLVLGGAPMDGPRYIEWNFVASSEALIQRAKEEWKQDRFGKVPGDEVEFIPLPGR
jgi:redox-sensitive bicupin YhaK (pirin superfamily)